MKNHSILMLLAFSLLLGCSADRKQEFQKQKLPLSTDPIQITKTVHNQISTDFDPCVFKGEELISHFGYPEDSFASQKHRGSRCFITLQRDDPKSDKPYANFRTSIIVGFDGFTPRNATELTGYKNHYKNPVTLSGYGNDTYSVTPTDSNDLDAIIGFPPGGSYYLSIRSVYDADLTSFRVLGNNLNARLMTAPTIE